MLRVTIAVALTSAASMAVARDQQPFIGTWEKSPAGLPTVATIGTYRVPLPVQFAGTIRYRLRISEGGRSLRLRFSNEYGESPLRLAAVSIGRAKTEFDADDKSLTRVTFGGETSIEIPPGAPAVSDVVALPLKSFAEVLVSVFVPQGVPMFACLQSWPPSPASQRAVEGIDATLTAQLAEGKCMLTERSIVSRLDVLPEHDREHVVVALGDSITDGSIDAISGDRGWTDALARRLSGASIVNAGIGGNRLLQGIPMFGASALARADRDVLSVPGLTHIVVLEGINDIGDSGPGGAFGDTPLVQPAALIAVYQQLIERAHERGIKIIGATMLPFAGAQYYSPAKDAVRESVNAWIRGSKKFDGVIDFEAAMRDPHDARHLKPEYDSGDHLHPNAAGYRAMGEFIDVRLFQ